MGKIRREKKTSPPPRWTTDEEVKLIAMRRSKMSNAEVAESLQKSERAVAQKYLKLVPSSSPRKTAAGSKKEMTEDMKVNILSAVARKKNKFWAEVATEVGGGITGPQCEQMWNDEVRNK